MYDVTKPDVGSQIANLHYLRNRVREIEIDGRKTTIIDNIPAETFGVLLENIEKTLRSLNDQRNEYLNKLDAVITRFMKEDD